MDAKTKEKVREALCRMAMNGRHWAPISGTELTRRISLLADKEISILTSEPTPERVAEAVREACAEKLKRDAHDLFGWAKANTQFSLLHDAAQSIYRLDLAPILTSLKVQQ